MIDLPCLPTHRDVHICFLCDLHAGISNGLVYGEAGSVNKEELDQARIRVRARLANYDPAHIINADEIGLCPRARPVRGLKLNRQQHGPKQDKLRYTVLLMTKMDGSKLNIKPTFIGRSQNPHCLTHVNRSTLPCTYRAQPNAWQTLQLYTESVLELESRAAILKEKFALICDEPSMRKFGFVCQRLVCFHFFFFLIFIISACHRLPADVLKKLKWVEVIYLPSNMTSKIQPNDCGYNHSVKASYMRNQCREAVVAMDQGKVSSIALFFSPAYTANHHVISSSLACTEC